MERVMPPGGYSTGLAEPRARTVQETRDQGRRVTLTWFDPPFRPEPPHSNQAYGICFTQAGLIVLGGGDAGGERYWNLLGGGVEPGETLEGCLAREVMEEGCARVVASRYIGCQRVDDPEHPAGPRRYYQTRFWARVDLLPWDPQHEIAERRLVRPDEFLQTLSWGTAPSAAIILAEGLTAEGRHGQRLRLGICGLEMRRTAPTGIRFCGHSPAASAVRPQQRHGHHARNGTGIPSRPSADAGRMAHRTALEAGCEHRGHHRQASRPGGRTL